MSMPLEVAIAVARNKLGPTAWACEEFAIGSDDVRRRWCTLGEQPDEYSRHVLGAGPTFEAALAHAITRDGRLSQRRSVR